jgi:hypothetical protein
VTYDELRDELARPPSVDGVDGIETRLRELETAITAIGSAAGYP